MSLSEIIYNEENSLKNSKSPNESVNILYNLIKLYHKNNQKDDVYKNIKKFMVFYIELIKDADYGYDNFNYNKINDVLSLTSAEERISILQYIISVSSRELPEHGREWFVLRKHNAEISNIKENRQYKLYFRMALLYLGQSINRLIIVFILFFALVFTALLPSPFESITIFKIKYELYSNNFIVNHFLNMCSLFADIDNDLKINPLNWLGVLLIIFSKIIFILLIVNFIYRKLSDKIAVK